MTDLDFHLFLKRSKTVEGAREQRERSQLALSLHGVAAERVTFVIEDGESDTPTDDEGIEDVTYPNSLPFAARDGRFDGKFDE